MIMTCWQAGFLYFRGLLMESLFGHYLPSAQRYQHGQAAKITRAQEDETPGEL